MPAPDYDVRLVSEVRLTNERGRWRVHLRYGEHRYDLGTFLLYGDAHHACTPSALEKAMSSPEKRAARQVADGKS